jgi:hypothetical protein
MRKLVVVVIVLYFVAAGILLLVDEPAAATVTILTIDEEYSFLITGPEDAMTFTLYLDDAVSSVCDPEQIVSARLEDDDLALALVLADVVSADRTVLHEGITYHEFHYSFYADGILSEGARLSFRSARLCLDFNDGTSDEYVVGDIEIVFGSPGTPDRLDFTRLYAVYDEESGLETLCGIVIAITNLTSAPLVIEDIDFACPGIAASLGEAVLLESETERVTDDPTADSGRSLLDEPVAGTIPVEGTSLWFIPVRHTDRLRAVTRFPVLLTFACAGDRTVFAIDDFAFRSSFPFPAQYGGVVHAVEHQR